MSDAPPAAGGGSRTVENVVTYLEMTAPPTGAPRPAPRGDLEIRRARQPTVSFYRYLYAAVGEPWTWAVRRWLSDAEVAAIIRDPEVEVNVLWAGGVPAGYAELDRRAPPDVELAYFGLMPEFIGQGLGAYLLDWTIRHAWRSRPRRLWLHTCDLDHPRALEVYQRAGFRIYDRHTSTLQVPLDMPLPRNAPAP
ncbi:MAG TPA: GNAT family N-acetyltransferase [Geminicoccaceae bacterium]|nr:GNAT family N-acetyltransferase [Geminicoccaceae bacterium]